MAAKNTPRASTATPKRFCAVAKSLFMMNKRAHGQEPGAPTIAWGFLIGGLVAWNFQLVAQGLDSMTGFNILGAFTGTTS